MNIIELQEELEYWPDQKIHEEVMRPTGAANGQTYLVVLEAERRNKERQAYQAALATQQQPQPTVVQETMMEFGGGQPMGGVPDVDPNLMQNQMMAQQMPQQQMPQQMPQGQPMAMKAGGAIRHQNAGQIAPWEAKLAEEGYMVDENGDIVPIEEQAGLQGPFGNTILGPEGWLLDADVYTGTGEGGFGLGRPDNPYTGRGWARTGNIALDLAKVKLAQRGLKAAKGAYKTAGGFKGMTKGIRDKYKEGIAGLRARLGGTRTTAQQPYDVPSSPFDVIASTTTKTIKPTSSLGKGVDIALNHPITTGVLAAGAVAGAVPDMEFPESIEAQVPKTLDKTQEKHYAMLRARLLQNARDIFDMKDPEAFNKFFGKNIPREEQYKNLLSLEASGTLPEINPQQPGGSEYGKDVASGRGRVIEEIESLLGGGDQALRDQQSAALVQLGAGIAAGDIAGGLSAAGREVSALKAARSAEKIKGIMALIELEYRQGLVGANEVSEMIRLLELWKENMGDPKAIAKLEAQIMSLMPRLRNTQSASAIRSLTESDLA